MRSLSFRSRGACLALMLAPAFASGGVEAREPPVAERDHSAEMAYSVSCRVDADGRIVATRHEPRNIYDHAESFAGRSHQSPRYEGREYGWGGRIPITDSLYTEYRQLPRFLNRQAFTRSGSADGVVYVYVQSLGCLFDRYVPRPSPAVAR